MYHPETHLVTEENGPRPNGPSNQCFYCGQVIGSIHKKDCVLRDRTVVLKMVTELVVTVPESWTKDQIEFQRNESSWCASNVAREIELSHCICHATSFEYLREAVTEDEANWDMEKMIR